MVDITEELKKKIPPTKLEIQAMISNQAEKDYCNLSAAKLEQCPNPVTSLRGRGLFAELVGEKLQAEANEIRVDKIKARYIKWVKDGCPADELLMDEVGFKVTEDLGSLEIAK